MGHGHHDHHAPGATHEPVVHDPENDINAKSATMWVIGGTVVLFLSLWVMLPIFSRVLEIERESKVYKAENKELAEVRAREDKFLHGGPVKIEDVVKKLAGK